MEGYWRWNVGDLSRGCWSCRAEPALRRTSEPVSDNHNMLKKRLRRIFTYHLGERLPQQMAAGLYGRGVRAYWYRELVNFGDLITPLILRSLGYRPIHSY